jgi:DNA helicase-2/ATP-dependent DNA helicase PcrA
MAWSNFQENIFSFVQNETGNGIVEAVAGSGKTTTIVHALKMAKGTTIFLAFNKAIAEELKARGVNARTFHSLVFGPVMTSRKQNQPNLNKLRDLCDANMKGFDKTLYQTFACKMVGLARQVGIGCLVADTEQAWIDIAAHHDIEPDHEDADFGRAIELARALLDWSNASPQVDFDDMLYFAVKDGLSLTKFDFVFVDEAQDTNAIQRAILRKIMKPTTRIVAVGDPAQAIYGFRGADSNSLNLIAEEFNCKRMPLSITYRCPTSVVKYAQQWVGHIQAAEGAAEGEVNELGTKWDPSIFQAQDLVVCRKTAPLITLAYRLIRARKPVTVMGREIGQGLKALIKKMKVSRLDLLTDRLEQYRDREVEKARAKGDDAKMEAIEDKVNSILFLIDSMDEGEGIYELEQHIDSLFTNKADATIFATIHKSKGLEADRVFWLNRSECPAQWARQAWQQEQEVNLCYVATTRAKKALFTLEMKDHD